MTPTDSDSATDPDRKTGFLDPDHAVPQPWERFAAFLREEGHSFAPAPPPRQFAGGFGNLNYLIELDGATHVLRTPPPGPLPPGANDMNREYRVLSRIWKAFPLAPRALVFGEAGVLEHPFFIMEYRQGRVIGGTMPADMAGQGGAVGDMLISVLAEFHAVDPAAVDLDTLGKPDGFLARGVAGWIKRCGVASADIYPDGAPPASAREIGAWLEAQTIPEGDVTLLHNDFKLDNIVLKKGAPGNPGSAEPIAVLDWDMCTRGDPLFDLGTLLSYWTEPGDPQAMHDLNQMPTADPTAGFVSREAAVAAYAKATGRDVSDFVFYRVLTMFKLCVIFLQLYARHKRGDVRDPRYEPFGGLAEAMLDFTLDIARGRAF